MEDVTLLISLKKGHTNAQIKTVQKLLDDSLSSEDESELRNPDEIDRDCLPLGASIGGESGDLTHFCFQDISPRIFSVKRTRFDKLLVLDLDGTLIHSEFTPRPCNSHDFELFDSDIFVFKRPFLDYFLRVCLVCCISETIVDFFLNIRPWYTPNST